MALSSMFAFVLLSMVVGSFAQSVPTDPGDVKALNALYTAYGSPAALVSWSGTDPCNATAVAALINCTLTGTTRVITNLNLASGKAKIPVLGGTLPTQIGGLVNLVNLQLADLGLLSLPAELANLQKLQTLWLDDNKLGPVVPDVVFNITSLQNLYLQNNGFTTMPKSIGALVNLMILDVSSNPWAAPFPEAMGNLANLGTFYANNASLGAALIANGTEDALPAWFFTLTSLHDVSFDNSNGWSAVLPDTWDALTRLGYFSAINGKLFGPVPPSFGKLLQLGAIRLSSNSLNGTIPKELGTAINLHMLLLDHNKLTGPIPTEVASLPRLDNLDISNNIINGTIPLAFGGVVPTAVINLNNNNLTGPLPSFLVPKKNVPSPTFNYTGNHFCCTTAPCLCPNTTSADLLQIIRAGFGNPKSLLSWNGTDACSPNLNNQPWVGITCNATGGAVSALSLSAYNLTGSIPVEVTQLTGLTKIDVSKNTLQGAFPAYLGNLTFLKDLNIAYNNFSGTLPANATGSLGSLNSLDISYNLFTGALPLWLANITTLTYNPQKGAGFCNDKPGGPCTTTVAPTIPVTTAAARATTVPGSTDGTVVPATVAASTAAGRTVAGVAAAVVAVALAGLVAL